MHSLKIGLLFYTDIYFGGFPGSSSLKETPQQTQNSLESYTSHLAWECLGIPQEEVENVAWERDDWNSLLSLLQPQPEPDHKQKVMDVRMVS